MAQETNPDRVISLIRFHGYPDYARAIRKPAYEYRCQRKE